MQVFFLHEYVCVCVYVCALFSPGLVHRFSGVSGNNRLKPKENQLKVYEWKKKKEKKRPTIIIINITIYCRIILQAYAQR